MNSDETLLKYHHKFVPMNLSLRKVTSLKMHKKSACHNYGVTPYDYEVFCPLSIQSLQIPLSSR